MDYLDNLCIGIVKMAADDYRTGYKEVIKVFGKVPTEKEINEYLTRRVLDNTTRNRLKLYLECRKFFLQSEMIYIMSDVPGSFIVRKIEEECNVELRYYGYNV